MTKEEYIAYVIQLQTQLDAVPKLKELSVREISEKIAEARMMLLDGIQKQIKKVCKLLNMPP